MGWKNITGEEKIVPSSGSGAIGNMLSLENGKPSRVRLLLQGDQEPYSYLEHCIENETLGDNGQNVRNFRTVPCARTKEHPNAPCPLCDGQQSRRRVRHVAPVWDYDTNSVKFLNQGEDVYGVIGNSMKMGVDPSSVDWTIMRSGSGRNDTKYTIMPSAPTPFTWPADFTFPDLAAMFAPATEDQMKAAVAAVGLDWNKIINPPELEYPKSIKDALDHVMPNGKYKGQTLGTLFSTNKGMIDFLSRSDRQSPEKAAAQVILVAMAGANIPGVPNYAMGGAAQQPAQQATNASKQEMSPPANTTPPAANTPPVGGKQDKINTANAELTKAMTEGRVSSADIAPVLKECGNGKTNINMFTDEELDALISRLRG